jgi:hypothetical protein
MGNSNISKKEKVDNHDDILQKFKDNEIHDDIKSLTGILKVDDPRNFDWKKEKYEYLMEKYLSIKNTPL